MKYFRLNHKSEQGVMTIVVTFIVLILITLIVLGFSRVSQNDQRQSLDRQLSTEASYSAESGINDIIKTLNADAAAGTAFVPKTDCSATSPSATHYVPTGNNVMTLPAALSTNLGGATSSSQFTCFLVKSSLPDLKYNSLSTDKSARADFTVTDPANDAVTVAPDEIVISWSGSLPTYRSDPSFSFPNASVWGGTAPILKIDLTDIGSGGYSRNGMINNTFTGFFYPNGTAAPGNNYGTTTFASGLGDTNRGKIVDGNCFGSHPANVHLVQDCNIAISLPASSSHFLIRLQTIYTTASATVTALKAGVKQNIAGGQIQIDVTGLANDVVKREQVRISPQLSVASANFAVQSADSICKRLITSSSPSINTMADPTIPGLDLSGACAP